MRGLPGAGDPPQRPAYARPAELLHLLLEHAEPDLDLEPWLTPHSLAFLVDHLGTRRIDPDKAREMYDAPAGVALYVT